MVPSKDDLRPQQQHGGVSLWYIATRAGVSDRSDNWILGYVRLLVANERFPPPLPAYDVFSKTKRGDIHLSSRWYRVAVDAWFDGLMPPHLAAVNDDTISARDGHLLDQRASELAGVARLG